MSPQTCNDASSEATSTPVTDDIIPPGEEIVISGVSGKYPECENVLEFGEKLMNKIDMITSDNRRWENIYSNIPWPSGKLNNLEKFDAGFFDVPYNATNCMDPELRLLLEKSWEAVIDSGINPVELEGSRCGVYIGVSISETECHWYHQKLIPESYPITGNSRVMLANRVSYFMKLNGPSMATDTACSSSAQALVDAYKALRRNEIDYAIVGGSHLVLHANGTLQFYRLGVLNNSGKCRTFDQDADGYTRSEAVSAVLLQKAKTAKRIYAEMLYADNNCDGFKEQGINFPSKEVQEDLMRRVVDKAKVDASSVVYLEAHGTSTKAGDPEEVESIDRVYGQNRTTPLLIGSVKSNVGHSEPSSGLTGLTKLIIAMETGIIPPNINFNKPKDVMRAIIEGRLKVVCEPTPYDDGEVVMGLNNFGFGGANCHMLLRRHTKTKINNSTPRDDLPRLVCIGGRTEEAIETLLDSLKKDYLDAEHVALLHNIFKKPVHGFLQRGYSILTKTGEIQRMSSYYSEKRDLHLHFSEFGPSWHEIGKALLAIPIFSGSIHNFQKILDSKNVNITDIILNETKNESFGNYVLGTVAIQMGIVDVLKVLGVVPVFISGESFCELTCAYFENAMTTEEVLLCAYSIADVIKNYSEAPQIKNETNGHIPNGIPKTTNKIISYENNLINDNTNKDKVYGLSSSKKIEYIEKCKPILLQNLNKILVKDRKRSDRWLSTSSNEKLNAGSLVEALVSNSSKNLYNKLTKKSFLLEIGKSKPDFNYSSIISETFNPKSDCLVAFLESLGSLYLNGYDLKLDELYPKISFPVSRSTSMISPFIRWIHKDDWSVYLAKNEKVSERNVAISSFKIDNKHSAMKFVSGHVIDGLNLFPATGYLFLAWKTLADCKGYIFSDLKVVFENIRFNRATTVPKDGSPITLSVFIQLGGGDFEVSEGSTAVVTGRVRLVNDCDQVPLPLPSDGINSDALPLTTKDIYKELRLRGYNYKEIFRAIVDCDTTAQKAHIKWVSNYVALMDNMLQLKILQLDSRALYVPTFIDKVSIDGPGHTHFLNKYPDGILPAYAYADVDVIQCGGIEIRGLKASSIVRRKALGEPVLEKYVFIPNETSLPLNEAIKVNMQVILENYYNIKFKVVEVVDEASNSELKSLSPKIAESFGEEPLIAAEIFIFSDQPIEVEGVAVEKKKLTAETDCLLIIGSEFLLRHDVLQQAWGSLKKNGFILSRESLNLDVTKTKHDGLDILTVFTTDKEKLVMFRKSTNEQTTASVTPILNENFSWLKNVQSSAEKEQPIVLYSQNDDCNGILGLTNCLKREVVTSPVRCFFIRDKNAPNFDLQKEFYRAQFTKNLAINVFKNGQWGTYRHLLLEDLSSVETKHCFVNTLVRGDLSTLTWIEGHLSNRPTASSTENCIVHVNYCALNFKDVMLASGRISADAMHRLSQEQTIGMEFSGITDNGRRVMGFLECGGLATVIETNKHTLIDVPDKWTLEDAATVPIVYVTVLYAVFHVGRMKRGESILIHAGTGGIGQAAINVALHHGVTVFTTVGTDEKREFIKKKFPQIPDSHIGNSRDSSFEDMIKIQTNGRGVDLVLNSLAEEKLLASVRCLARGGRFLEIGKFDLMNNNLLNLLFIEKEATHCGIFIDMIFNETLAVKNTLTILIKDGIKNGYIKPLERYVFEEDDIEKAFRYMAGSKHMGKILIKIREEEKKIKNIEPDFKIKEAYPRYYCDSSKSYIICGGLGGFGLELADWLVVRGARKLVLTSRVGVKTGYQSSRIRTWKSYGTEVIISTSNIVTREGCEELIMQASDLGEVDGIFNLAVVLLDNALADHTEETFTNSFGPKAVATQHLDDISRKLCPTLRTFVVFSSVSCGRGNVGQINYGMANSVMERICEKRQEEGYPALAVQWGAVGDVGLVAEMQEEDTVLEIGGTLQQSISSCLKTMDKFLRQNHPVVASMIVAEKQYGASADNCVDAIANILGITNMKTVSMQSTLAELGMDSMRAVEVKQTLERDFEIILTPKEIRSLTFAKLQAFDSDSKETGTTERADINESLKYFTTLIEENLSVNDPVLKLETKVKGEASKVFLLPGIEGVANFLLPLASNLNCTAYCIQFAYKSGANLLETAQRILPYIEKETSKKEPFRLVGHSFGGLLALEAAAKLEAQGYSGKIILIDTFPGIVKEFLKDIIEVAQSDEDFDNLLILFIAMMATSQQNITEHMDKIKSCSSLEDKIKTALDINFKETKYPRKHIEELLVTMHKLFKTTVNYQPSFPKLKSQVFLFKATQKTVQNASNDYNLSELCENPVQVFEFEGNHATILENEEMHQHVNKILFD